jgi:hypothetical protein
MIVAIVIEVALNNDLKTIKKRPPKDTDKHRSHRY